MSGKELPWLPDFKIAFTFTGEYRKKIVRPVCEELLKLGYRKEEIFFDEWHPELFTGVNADTVFRKIYHDKSKCVVALLSPNYTDKQWTGNLEWPTVRALINAGAHHMICLLRVDDVDINKIEGLYAPRDVARSIDRMTPEQIALFLHKWYCVHILRKSPDADVLKTERGPGRPHKPEAPTMVSQSGSIPDIEAAEAQPLSALKQATPSDSLMKWLKNGNVLFGSYPQTEAGERQPIEWLVLKREQNLALLVSRFVLAFNRYHFTFKEITWENCSLRRWLNEEFIQSAFTTSEEQRILTCKVPAHGNKQHYSDPGNSTNDRVFLLSSQEAEPMLLFSSIRPCRPTIYALTHIEDRTALNKLADHTIGCSWWLRTAGYSRLSASYVLGRGDIIYDGRSVNTYLGVRPAIWVWLPDVGNQI